MKRDVFTLQLYRPNFHMEERPLADAWEIIQVAIMCGLYLVIAWLVMGGF